MKVSILVPMILIHFSSPQVLSSKLNQTKVQVKPNQNVTIGKVVANQGFQAIIIERKISNDQRIRSNKLFDQQKNDGERQREKERKDKEVTSQWTKLEETLSKYFQHSIHSNFIPTFENLFQNNNVSIRCQSTIQRILLDASKLQKYAIQSKCHSLSLSRFILSFSKSHSLFPPVSKKV